MQLPFFSWWFVFSYKYMNENERNGSSVGAGYNRCEKTLGYFGF